MTPRQVDPEIIREFLTESELAKMLHIPKSTLRWHRFVGLPPTYMKFGRSVRYPIRDGREFIQSNIHVPATLAAVEE